MKNIRKIITAGIIAITATLSVGATQASAATSTTACFYWGSGTPAAGAPYMNRPVQLWKVNSVGTPISKVRDGNTGANGCATFYNTDPSMNLRMRAVKVDSFWWGNAVYEGWTSRFALPGQGGALLGVGYVYRVA